MKKTIITFTMLAVIALSVFAQQYDPESDFQISKRDDGKSIEISKYVGSKKTVNIPPRIQGLPVTVIGVIAFSDCTGITGVTIPDSVIRIGSYAFSGCTSLTSVTIPNSVTAIGEGTFALCPLTSVTFQGVIASNNFSSSNSFPGDLRDKYLAGGIGTYTRASGSETWTKK